MNGPEAYQRVWTKGAIIDKKIFFEKIHLYANHFVVFVTDKYHPINFLADIFFAFTSLGSQ